MTVTFIELGKKGQLGNQLFQVSATIGTALRHNDNWMLPKWEYSDYFNIPSNKFYNNIKVNLTYSEPHFHYSGIPSFKGKIASLSGYFQSHKYWQDYAGIIKEYLTPNVAEDCSNYTSIHVRRTDYLIHKECYNILTLENYYEKAMEACPSKNYLIFSDDLRWCKEHFKGNSFNFSEERHPVKDLARMISCTNHIAANSSFSWWGSYLDLDSNKTVIAPKTWFGPKLASTHNTQDLFPSEWIQV